MTHLSLRTWHATHAEHVFIGASNDTAVGAIPMTTGMAAMSESGCHQRVQHLLRAPESTCGAAKSSLNNDLCAKIDIRRIHRDLSEIHFI